MNILGEGFPDDIIKQVATRQKVYGSGYIAGNQRTPEEILYLNANTAWCKLISGADIVDTDVLNIPSLRNLNKKGPDLAKQFILANGTSYLNNGKTVMRGGIDFTNSWDGNNKAYGIGGSSEFGIRPMPGIISADISHENRGSIRKATVKLKAWNKFQFEIIDVLYLRLGFSVLLEWGNTMYFDNKYIYQPNPNFSLADSFLNGKFNYNTFLLEIDKQRIKSQGNYDAMFAKVCNFSWSFQRDGSYDITINLISSGDIIESLKVNAILEDPLSTSPLNKDKEQSDKVKLPETSDELVQYYAKKNTIGYFLYQIWILLSNKTPPAKRFGSLTEDVADDGATFSFSDFTPDILNQLNTQFKSDQEVQSTLENLQNPLLSVIGLGSLSNAAATVDFFTDYEKNTQLVPTFAKGYEPGYIDAINWEFDAYDSDGGDEQYFIRFGTFLSFIQNKLLPVCTGGQDNKDGQPLLQIDYDTQTNIFALDKWQVSEDPRIAIIGRTIHFPENAEDIDAPEKWKEIIFYRYNSPIENDKIGEINGVKYGNIMNIYLNFIFLIKKIDELKDDQGKLSLFDYIKAICEGINEALGGLNNFEPIIDERTNRMKIIDQNPLPNRDEVIAKLNKSILKDNPISTKLAQFDLYGYSTIEPDPANPTYNGASHASFIRDFNFATEITPEYATMITVGASANGSVVGENSTALSKLNIGLKDRYKEEIIDRNELERRRREEIDQAKKDLEKQNEELKAMRERYSKTIEDYYSFLNDMEDKDLDINTDDINTYKGTLKNLVEYKLQLINKQEAIKELSKTISKNPNEKPPIAIGTGFIPFNLSITTDGLSGMRIYSKFTIDTKYLPTNYPDRVEFLIKNITHNISDNKWTTKLESFCVAKGKFSDVQTSSNTTSTSTQTTAALNKITASSKVEGTGKWANELRKVLSSLGYTEKGKELDNGGDISENIYKAASSIFTTIKKEIPSLQVKVTGGNDLYHQNLSYISRHKNANAIDFVVTPSTPKNLDAVVTILRRYAAGNSPNFRFIDEYRNLTPAGTANHFHISWGAGTEGQKELNISLDLASKNKISSIKIV